MILCIIHQLIWSWMHDSGSSAPEFTRKHIMKCETCRQTIDAMSCLDNSLQKKNETPADTWHAAVMNEIHHVGQEINTPWPMVRTLQLTMAGAMAAALVVALLVYNSGPSLETRDKADGLLAGPVSTLEHWVASLENEGTALEQDARSAARMATQCLPF